MTKVNHVISRSLIIKKIILLNVFIQEDAKIQSRCRRCTLFFTMISTSDSIAIMQYHKDQWNQRWEKYRERVADINTISAQRLHLRSRMLQDADFSNYWIIVIITKSLRAVAKIMMKTKLLKQFKVTKTLVH